MKKILYLDMDGVIADFEKGIQQFLPDFKNAHSNSLDYTQPDQVNKICQENPLIFHTLPAIQGAIESTKELLSINEFDVYFLSTPMWNVPESFTGKRVWLENHFGDLAENRLILTKRKDLAIGHLLVDDTLKNGVDKFKGIHIHFGTEMFPNWDETLRYLKAIAKNEVYFS